MRIKFEDNLGNVINAPVERIVAKTMDKKDHDGLQYKLFLVHVIGDSIYYVTEREFGKVEKSLYLADVNDSIQKFI